VNAARLLLDPDADVDVDVLLEALEPQAAISPVEAMAAIPSATRRARILLGWGSPMCFLSVLDQPAAPALLLVVVLPPEPAPPPGRAALAPESLTEVAASVPFLPVAPWMTSASPGRSADFEVL
jgi:hypothetical protein